MSPKDEHTRPLCLYENTCLDKKQKTKDCKTCIHHTDYWAEVAQKELTEKVKKYEQKLEKIRERCKNKYYDNENGDKGTYIGEYIGEILQIISEVENGI